MFQKSFDKKKQGIMTAVLIQAAYSPYLTSFFFLHFASPTDFFWSIYNLLVMDKTQIFLQGLTEF